MVESLPTMVDTHIKEQVPQATCRPSAIRPRDQDDPYDDAHPEGENSVKRQKKSKYEAYVSGESSFGQINEEERGPSTLGNQEQVDNYDFWTDSYASDDDEIPTNNIVWESRKEILVSPHPRKTIPLVQSCQRDPEAPALSLINQDLLYLKKGSSGPKKIVIITKPDYKNLNKNDIEDMYLLIMNGKDPDYAETSYQQKVNLTTPTISFPEVEKHKMFPPTSSYDARCMGITLQE
ncbi:hypothetical protein Tco_1532176 [Tanacetum coccineum]